MTGRPLLPLTLLLALGPGDGRHSGPPGDAAGARIFTDLARHALVIDLPPLDLPAHTPHHALAQPPIAMLEIPSDGYVHGFRVAVVDSAGHELPDELIHHYNLIDPDHRELFLPISRRLLAAGHETGAVRLPGLLFGLPLRLDPTRPPPRPGAPLPRARLLRQSHGPGGPGRRDGRRGRAVRARPWRRVAARRPRGLAVSAGLSPLHAAERRARDADGGEHAHGAAGARARGPPASLNPPRSSSSTSAEPSMPMACTGARGSTQRTGRPGARSGMRRSRRSTNGPTGCWPGRRASGG